MTNASAALILNVDDHDAFRYARSRVLERAGYRLIEAGTGQETLRLVRRENPDLVILDVHLPDMDGVEVCRRIKSDPALSGTMVLQASASETSDSAKIRGLDGGADGYLVEPAEPPMLIAHVRSLLRIRQAERAARRFKFISDNSSDSHFLIDQQGHLVHVNHTAALRFGYSETEMLDLYAWEVDEGGDRDAFRELFARAQREQVPLLEIVRRRKDGSTFVAELSFTGVRFEDAPFLFVAGRDVTERKRTEEAFRFLAEWGGTLAASLDYGKTLPRVARLAVPFLADWCLIQLVRPDGQLEQTALAHVSPHEEAIVRAALAAAPAALGELFGAQRVLGSGVAEHVAALPAPEPAAHAEPAWAVFAQREPPRAYMTLPLQVHGQVLGVLTFVSSTSGRSFDAKEFQLAQLLATRAALAVDNGRLYAEAQELTRHLEARVSERTDELRRLANHLQTAREDERLALARELHDGLGQLLTTLRIQLSRLWKKAAARQPSAEERQDYQGAIEMVDSTISAMRDVVKLLRPAILDDFGLVAALEWQAEEFQAHTGLECRFHTNVESVALQNERALAVFRIVQESLTNVARHAQATRVDVELELDESRLLVRIRDNGVGASPESMAKRDSHGILGMRERALLIDAQVEVDSRPGTGTTVRLEAPL